MRSARFRAATRGKEGRADDGLAGARTDFCRLGFLFQAAGPKERAVLIPALAGTAAQMHAAILDPTSYLSEAPANVAYEQDQSDFDARSDDLYNRKYVWEQAIPDDFDLPTETPTDFSWPPDFYGDLGITGFYIDQFFKLFTDRFVPLEPLAAPDSLARCGTPVPTSAST